MVQAVSIPYSGRDKFSLQKNDQANGEEERRSVHNKTELRPARTSTTIFYVFETKASTNEQVDSAKSIGSLTRLRSAACSRKPPDAEFKTVLMALARSCFT